ncbi:MAG: Nif3-like dinuclear metal center hexameric protein [Clostridia bacterium]|nr:Nif3-like dinuclear metal center hexameric protein [Clostridia bacterium]
MITVNNVLEFLKEKYPLDTACDFDNVGLLVGDGNNAVNRAVVCLDCDINTVNYAKSIGAELIVTHHPVIFSGLKSILAGGVVYELVKSDISVISMHTNLDIAVGGVTERLCEVIGLKNVKPFVSHSGFLIREAQSNITDADKLARHIKTQLGTAVRYANGGNDICRVLVCSGSGGEFLQDVISGGYDALISADIKHNVFIDAVNAGVTVFDAGHYQSENVIVSPILCELKLKFNDVVFSVYNNPNIKFI